VEGIGEAEVLALSLGVAVQNLPEGAVVSMPLHKVGLGRWRAFGAGVASGVVEPLGAAAALCLAPATAAVLPWMLGFAAGAMLYVVAAELLPEAGEEGTAGAVWFILGFTVMMVLDVALG
jgi:ZIP family zinc transporter